MNPGQDHKPEDHLHTVTIVDLVTKEPKSYFLYLIQYPGGPHTEQRVSQIQALNHMLKSGSMQNMGMLKH